MGNPFEFTENFVNFLRFGYRDYKSALGNPIA